MGGKGGGGGNATWAAPGMEAGALTPAPPPSEEPTAEVAAPPQTMAAAPEQAAAPVKAAPEVKNAAPQPAASPTAALGQPVSPGGPIAQPTAAQNVSTGDALAGAIGQAPYWQGDINEYGRRVTRPGATAGSLKVTQS